MAEPVDPAADYRATRGAVLKDLLYRAYDPAADTHADEPGEECVGGRGPVRVAEEAGRKVSRAAWTITGVTDRPVLRSLLVDGDDSWVVETATPDPGAGAVFACDTYLGDP